MIEEDTHATYHPLHRPKKERIEGFAELPFKETDQLVVIDFWQRTCHQSANSTEWKAIQ
jgi:hypothetical protein